MPRRVNSLVSAVFAGSLASAIWIGGAWVASAADDCVDKPPREAEAGHWYYYTDRVHHRKCWFFEAEARPSTEQTPPQQSWFSGVVQTFFPEPKQDGISTSSPQQSQNGISAYSEAPQNGISDNSGAATKTASPRRARTNKAARRALPTTDGLGNVERHDQLPAQRVTEKAEKPAEKQARQLTPEGHEELFQSFLKWYRDRTVFGQP